MFTGTSLTSACPRRARHQPRPALRDRNQEDIATDRYHTDKPFICRLPDRGGEGRGWFAVEVSRDAELSPPGRSARDAGSIP